MPLELNGFRVYIECGGMVLPQYQDKQIDKRTMRCYIPSQAGKSFRIITSLINPAATAHDGFIAALWADGKKVTTLAMSKKERLAISKARISMEEERRLVFAAVQTTDREGLAVDTDLSSIGLLEVRATFADKDAEPTPWPQDWPDLANAAGLVNERSKKAGFNMTGLGASTVSLAPSHTQRYRTMGGQPDAIFEFYHQPQGMLQAAGIAPASHPAPASTPPPATTSRKRPTTQRATTEAGLSKRTRTKPKLDGARRQPYPYINMSSSDSDGSDLIIPPLPLTSSQPAEIQSESESEMTPIRPRVRTRRRRKMSPNSGSEFEEDTVQVPRIRKRKRRAALLDSDKDLPLPERPAPHNARPNRRVGGAKDSNDMDFDGAGAGEDIKPRVVPSPPPLPTLPPPIQHAKSNAEAGPSTLTRAERRDSEEDVKPRLPAASAPRPTEDVKPSLQGLSSNVVDRAAQLRAQIAAREIRVKRLAEEEQLALERAELAQLEAQTRAQQGKGTQRERGEVREVLDLTIED